MLEIARLGSMASRAASVSAVGRSAALSAVSSSAAEVSAVSEDVGGSPAALESLGAGGLGVGVCADVDAVDAPVASSMGVTEATKAAAWLAAAETVSVWS